MSGPTPPKSKKVPVFSLIIREFHTESGSQQPAPSASESRVSEILRSHVRNARVCAASRRSKGTGEGPLRNISADFRWHFLRSATRRSPSRRSPEHRLLAEVDREFKFGPINWRVRDFPVSRSSDENLGRRPRTERAAQSPHRCCRPLLEEQGLRHLGEQVIKFSDCLLFRGLAASIELKF